MNKSLLERVQDAAITKIDKPGLKDHLSVATLYLETCPPKEVHAALVRLRKLEEVAQLKLTEQETEQTERNKP